MKVSIYNCLLKVLLPGQDLVVVVVIDSKFVLVVCVEGPIELGIINLCHMGGEVVAKGQYISDRAVH